MNADKYNTFIDGAVTLAQGTYYSDTVKIGKQGLAYGLSKLRGQVTTAFTSGGAATVQFVFQRGDAVDSSDNLVGPADILDTGALAMATLVDNYDIWDRYMEELDWQEAAGSDTYLQVKMVVATADLTAGDVQIELKGLDSQNTDS
jgi:hypothetical protein